MNKKLVIVSFIVLIIAGIILLFLIGNHFHLTNTSEIQPMSTPSTPRHLSINQVENFKIGQNP